MKGSLRVALLLFTALPVQRWLLAGGAVMVAAVYLLLPQEARVLALVGLVLGLFPTLLASGVLLRYLVAPRVMQLIPHMRLQILGAMFLVPVIFATSFAALFLTVWPAGDLLLIWLRVITAVSLLLISQFMLFGTAVGASLWFGLVIVAIAVPSWTGSGDFYRWIGQSPEMLFALLALSWCGFASWLLRPRPLAAPRVSKMVALGTQIVRASQHNAVRAFLFGNPSLPAQFVAGLLAVVFITLMFGLIASMNGRAHSFAEMFTRATWLAMGVGAYAGIGGWLVARRSKYLWLRCGLDRRELFRLCEREAWSSFVATSSGTFLLLPIMWLKDASNGLEFTALLAFQLCSGACLLYLGLTWVRGWRAVDVLMGLALFVAWGVASVCTPYLAEHLPMALTLSAAMLVTAFALRLLGLYRWRRIDWLVCKPPPPLARNELNPV